MDALLLQTAPSSQAGCPEYTSKQAPGPKYTPTPPEATVVGKIFVFPFDRIASLRKTLAAETGCNVTAFVVLAALVWVHTTKARAKTFRSMGLKESNLGIAVDARPRLGFGGEEKYYSNLALYTKVAANIEDFGGAL